MSTLILDRREFLKAGTVAGTGLLIRIPPERGSRAKDPAEEQEKENSQSFQRVGAHFADNRRDLDSAKIGNGSGRHDRGAD